MTQTISACGLRRKDPDRLARQVHEAMEAGFDAGYRTACDLFEARIAAVIPNPPRVVPDPREWLGILTRILKITALVRRSGDQTARGKQQSSTEEAANGKPQLARRSLGEGGSEMPLVRTGQGDFTQDLHPEDLEK